MGRRTSQGLALALVCVLLAVPFVLSGALDDEMEFGVISRVAWDAVSPQGLGGTLPESDAQRSFADASVGRPLAPRGPDAAVPGGLCLLI